MKLAKKIKFTKQVQSDFNEDMMHKELIELQNEQK